MDQETIPEVPQQQQQGEELDWADIITVINFRDAAAAAAAVSALFRPIESSQDTTLINSCSAPVFTACPTPQIITLKFESGPKTTTTTAHRPIARYHVARSLT